MINHTVCLTPFGFPARTFVVMALLWFQNTHVTGGELLHARVAITLGKTFVSFSTAGLAVDFPEEMQAKMIANDWVQR